MGVLFGIIMIAGMLWPISMMGNMTSTIIDTSILVILICLVRRGFRGKISASAIHSLWGLVALRYFATPILAELRDWSFVQGLFRISAVNTLNSGINEIRKWVDPKQLLGVEGNSPVRVDLFALSLPIWFFVLWIVGVIVVYLWSVYVNEKFRRWLFDNRITVRVPECPYPIYKVPGIISPCVMRVKGKIGVYLTEEAVEDEEKREYVLAHELCHLKHRDLFWGNIRCIILALNWFNPLIWLAAVLSKRDAEMACDERTVRKLGELKRLRYGKILVDLVADTAVKKNLFFTATTMSCGKRELADRVKRIANGKRRLLMNFTVVAFTIFMACMTSFVTRADVRGLSPEETVWQYIYYWNQDYTEGMKSLHLNRSNYGIKKHDEVSIVKCGNTKEGDRYEISPDKKEELSEGKYYDVRRFRLKIRKLVVDTDETGKRKARKVNSEEEFLLAKVTETTDWKIVSSTMDEDEFRLFRAF